MIRDIDRLKWDGCTLSHGLHTTKLEILTKGFMVLLANLRTRLQSALHTGVWRAVAICNELPIAFGGPALKGSLTVYLPPAVREWVETKCLSHCSSSFLRGSFRGISSSSQNLRSKLLVSHSAMQSDTWIWSISCGAIPVGPEMIQSKTVFWATGASVGPRRGDSRTSIDENRFDPISKWIGCWLDESGSASLRSLRWGHTPKGWVCESCVSCNAWKHIRC